MAIQEHIRLRNTVSALRQYKADLLIMPPKCKGSLSCEAEPFSKWLEEDPAEAFLTFDQEPSLGGEGTCTDPDDKHESKHQGTPGNFCFWPSQRDILIG